MTDPRDTSTIPGQGSAILDLLIKDREIMADAERLLSGRTRDIWLKGKTAQAFRLRTWRQRAKVVRSWMVWVLLLDLITLLLNIILLPREIALAMLAPGAPIVPAALAVALIWRKPHSDRVQGWSLAIGVLVILSSVCLMGMAAGGELLERYLHVMLFVAITGIIIFEIPFVQTQGIAIAALGLYLVFQFQGPDADIRVTLSGFFFFASGITATVVARRTMTILAQKSFLLELRDRRHMLELAESNRQLEQISRVDALTGVANRRWMREKLDAVWEQPANIALLMCDIDDFKGLNDHLGHLEGDRCLADIAQIIVGCVRSEADCVARYGGEEFLILLSDIDQAGALAIAERIRHRIIAAALPNPGSRVSHVVTASIGVALRGAHADGLTSEQLQARADMALYFAKRAGRNQVQLWDADMRAAAKRTDLSVA